MKYLTKVVETYRIDNEQEVESFLQELKEDHRFEIAKYSSTKKEVKVKGQVEDEYIHFDVTKVFNDEKDPERMVTISYDED
ncbi:MAG: hypothetical protein LUC37_01325 [Prevotella sp.]|nr:hypothetical protein [Prevotella sp.]